jgi:uncharacterized phage protein (TIGR01671 family)
MIPKYRAWDSAKKEMFKDTFAITESGQVVVVEQESVASFPDYVFVEHLVIMQSTGLKDKNGKEIFEGDILGTKDGLLNGVVEYRSDLGMWTNSLISYNNFERLCNVAGSREIIGNIYENPELLEDKE